MSLVQYCAGKGHMRVLRYLLDNGCASAIDARTPREGIGAVDRACKAGYICVLRVLIQYGARYKDVVRYNGETPAHGAAMYGHIDVLQELHNLGCDLQAKSAAGETPQMCAVRCHQTDAAEFLAELTGSGVEVGPMLSPYSWPTAGAVDMS